MDRALVGAVSVRVEIPLPLRSITSRAFNGSGMFCAISPGVTVGGEIRGGIGKSKASVEAGMDCAGGAVITGLKLSISAVMSVDSSSEGKRVSNLFFRSGVVGSFIALGFLFWFCAVEADAVIDFPGSEFSESFLVDDGFLDAGAASLEMGA